MLRRHVGLSILLIALGIGGSQLIGCSSHGGPAVKTLSGPGSGNDDGDAGVDQTGDHTGGGNTGGGNSDDGGDVNEGQADGGADQTGGDTNQQKKM